MKHPHRSRRLIDVLAGGVTVCALLVSPAGATCALADLHWMAGVWRADDATTRSEERWALGPGDRLIGSSWVLHPDRAGGLIEANTIQIVGGVVTLRLRHFSADLAVAREDKDAPMTFTAARCEADVVVFDGQGPQAGEHMTYRRHDDRMQFVGDFIHQGQPVRAEVDFVRAGD